MPNSESQGGANSNHRNWMAALLIVLAITLCGVWTCIFEGDSDSPATSSNSSSSKTSTAYKLAVVAGTRVGDIETTEKRFAFVLPRLDRICTDIASEERIADILVTLHRKLEEAGLEREEDLLQLTNNLYRLSNVVDTAYRAAGIDSGPPNKCQEPWATYITLRQQAHLPDDAIRSISAVVNSLVGG